MNDKNFIFLRWLPVAAAVALMILIAIVSVATVSELKNATYWREHTFQVILEAQAFEDKLIDTQTSVRGYIAKGPASLLVQYKNDTNIDLHEINELTELESGDPVQQQRLRGLAVAIKEVFAYDDRVLGVYARQGADAATKMNDATEGRDISHRALSDLQKFTDEEKELLKKRDLTEQKDYHRAARLLIIGSMVVAGLLIFANYIAGREMARRRRAEAEQRELIERLKTALAEVRTLSGLIPICGWCKSVRNDTGFWQSVEQYVRGHTDATFSHGICPTCAEKFKEDIARANETS